MPPSQIRLATPSLAQPSRGQQLAAQGVAPQFAQSTLATLSEMSFTQEQANTELHFLGSDTSRGDKNEPQPISVRRNLTIKIAEDLTPKSKAKHALRLNIQQSAEPEILSEQKFQDAYNKSENKPQPSFRQAANNDENFDPNLTLNSGKKPFLSPKFRSQVCSGLVDTIRQTIIQHVSYVSGKHAQKINQPKILQLQSLYLEKLESIDQRLNSARLSEEESAKIQQLVAECSADIRSLLLDFLNEYSSCLLEHAAERQPEKPKKPASTHSGTELELEPRKLSKNCCTVNYNIKRLRNK